MKAKSKENSGSNIDNTKYSSFEMLAGHIWRCACKARKLADDQDTEVFIPVSVEGPNCNPHSHLASLAMSFSEPHQLLPLWYAASCGHNALGQIDDDYLISALDYLELHRPCASPLVMGPLSIRCPNLRINSWIKLPIYDADFGWGRPIFMGTAALFDGMCLLLPSASNGGNLSLMISLPSEHMKSFSNLLYDIQGHNFKIAPKL